MTSGLLFRRNAAAIKPRPSPLHAVGSVLSHLGLVSPWFLVCICTQCSKPSREYWSVFWKVKKLPPLGLWIIGGRMHATTRVSYSAIVKIKHIQVWVKICLYSLLNRKDISMIFGGKLSRKYFSIRVIVQYLTTYVTYADHFCWTDQFLPSQFMVRLSL